MKKKEKLIQLITENNCIEIQCRTGSCPIYHRCTMVNSDNNKHIAAEVFLERYGSDELMEILL